MLLHLRCLLFGVLGWVFVQHFVTSADVKRALEKHYISFHLKEDEYKYVWKGGRECVCGGIGYMCVNEGGWRRK